MKLQYLKVLNKPCSERPDLLNVDENPSFTRPIKKGEVIGLTSSVGCVVVTRTLMKSFIKQLSEVFSPAQEN